jgi:hypothetical protein
VHPARPVQVVGAAVPPSNLPALTSLDRRGCGNVTAAGVQALRSSTATPNLHIEYPF